MGQNGGFGLNRKVCSCQMRLKKSRSVWGQTDFSGVSFPMSHFKIEPEEFFYFKCPHFVSDFDWHPMENVYIKSNVATETYDHMDFNLTEKKGD